MTLISAYIELLIRGEMSGYRSKQLIDKLTEQGMQAFERYKIIATPMNGNKFTEFDAKK